jgi:hypothetical protein
MSDFKCEFCGGEFKAQSLLNIHRAKTKACIEIQIKKLGKPLSEINKEKKALEEARKAEKKAKKESEKGKKEAEKAKKKTEKEKSKIKAEKTLSEAEEEISKKTVEKEIITEHHEDESDEEEIDENAEIPFSSEDESSSSSESDDEPYKVETLSTVQEVFNNIENYQRTNPARLNNLFKKKSTTVKTEIISDDQPPEVHKRKIEEYLPSKEPRKESSSQCDITQFSEGNQKLQKEISKIIEDKFIHLENKVMTSVTKLEDKINSMLDIIGKLEAGNEKRMKSIERVGIKDIERVMDEKLDDMFSITRKMLAEVESKSELLDIFRENMDDIIDKHYDLYKKFKYVKEDIEDMVYSKKR